ncbi:MAG: hypothetical protein CV045_09410 [Cyanobacteria bacterium M5B4]|nr:MAG: hypothetical protein CV045_09410 [Cyanobacteria bacterium M5B4]
MPCLPNFSYIVDFLKQSFFGKCPDWWEEFLQEWNYLVYLRARKVAWLTLVYPIVSIPTLWTVHYKAKVNESIIPPIFLTLLVIIMAVISGNLLFKHKFPRSVSGLTRAHINATSVYIVCFTLLLDAVFAIVWVISGLNSPYLIGIFTFSILFFRPSKWGLVLYGLNFIFYLVYISLFKFPPVVISVAYVSGILSTFLGLVVSNSLFQSRVQEFVNRRTIAAQTKDIYQLNDRLRLDNLRMGVELSVAKEIQAVILPKSEELQRITFLDVAAFMSPATEVGGDYFDVLVDRDQPRATIAIGDVTGHGLESGIFTVMIQSAVRLIHHSNRYSLAEAINLLNCLLYENAKRMASDKCVTFLLLQYDRGRVQVCGQHEEVILVRNNGHLETIDTTNLGFILGLESDISSFVKQQEFYLNHGDVLVLYTDGITEATNTNQECYGIDRLHQSIVNSYNRSAEEIRQNITDTLMEFIGTATIYDDITLVVIKQI